MTRYNVVICGQNIEKGSALVDQSDVLLKMCCNGIDADLFQEVVRAFVVAHVKFMIRFMNFGF